MRRLSIVFVAGLALASLAGQASAQETKPAGKLQVGQGQAIFPADADGKIDMVKLPAAMEQAYKHAMEQYGEGTPKIVLVMANVPSGTGSMIKFMHDRHARGAPMYGVGTGSYSMVGYEGFLDEKQPGMSVLALGGEITVQTSIVTDVLMPVKDWDLKAEAEKKGLKEDDLRAAERKKHADWGKQLASGVKPAAGKSNVFFQLGTQHVPRMTWVHEGTTAALGKGVYIIGAAASDFGYIWDNGKIIPNALLGVLVSGDFKVALAGSDSVAKDQLASGFRGKLTSLLAEMGGKPQLTVYFACVGWKGQLPEQKQVAQELLGGVPFFGCFAGGEIGRYTTGGEPISAAGQLMLLGMSGK